MSNRNTGDLVQQGEPRAVIPAELSQPAKKGLALLPPAQQKSTTSQGMLSTIPAWQPVAHTVQYTRCQCPRCRERRARKRAARTGQGQQHVPYIEGTIINVTPWMDEKPGGLGQGSTSTWTGPHPQASWPARLFLHGSGHKKFSLFTICMVVTLLLALIWVSGLGDHLVASLIPSPAATLTIIPESSRENSTVPVTAAIGPSGANRVAARILQGASPLRTVVARATGRGQTPASPSQGTLIFYNQGPSPQTIGGGISLTGADGIEVETLASVTIPAGNPPSLGTAEVGAQSVKAGSQANIAAGDINNLCCAAGISVKNTAFSGGQDAQTYPILRQDDIDAAAASVAQDLIAQAQHQVLSQVTRSEQLAVGPQCRTSANTAAPAGSHVVQASISVSDSCSGEVYDRIAALYQAAILFEQRMGRQLGPTYRLVSRVATSIRQANLTDAQHGTITVLVQAQGIWRYQFSRAEQQLIVRHVRGKSVSEALSLLSQQIGVAHTSISLSGGTESIPSDAARITIVILPVPG